MKRWIHAAKNYEEEKRLRTLAQESTDPDQLRQLADSEYESIIWDVAKNPNTPYDILEKFSNDENYFIRDEVAQNKNCPTQILEKLSDDSNVDVRQSVAQNKITPLHVIKKLADDPSARVRESILFTDWEEPSNERLDLPLSIYYKLLTDANSEVRFSAKRLLRYGYGDQLSEDVLLELLNNEDIEGYIRSYIEESRPEIKLNLKPIKDKKVSWKSFLSKLDNELENGDDPLYEQTEAGEHLQGLMQEVEEKLNLILEPSIQAGMGGMFIYQNDEEVAEVDYQDFNSDAIRIALNSRSKADFKKKYKAFLESII